MSSTTESQSNNNYNTSNYSIEEEEKQPGLYIIFDNDKCYLCDVNFKDKSHQTRHIQSQLHVGNIQKQKVELESIVVNNNNNNNHNILGNAIIPVVTSEDFGNCILCDVKYTSNAHSIRHIQSQLHQYQVKLIEQQIEGYPNIDSSSSATVTVTTTTDSEEEDTVLHDTSPDIFGECTLCKVFFKDEAHSIRHSQSKQHLIKSSPEWAEKFANEDKMALEKAAAAGSGSGSRSGSGGWHYGNRSVPTFYRYYIIRVR
jgi:uncharacterized C2H2 Zn-finger protein